MSRRASLPFAFLLLTACSAPPRPVVTSPPAPAASAAPRPEAEHPVELEPLPEKLGQWIDSYVAAFGEHYGEAYAFNGFLLVAQDGKPVVAKGYGKADRTTGAVADADTRFAIGSITKELTAVAILQLVEKGSIHLSDPLRKYLPEYPATGDRITIHQLLSHTSGIPNTKDPKIAETRDRPHAPAEIVASFADRPLAFEPGTAFGYSNSNYFLLGLILEKVSGEAYGEYLRKHLLGPAGMTSTDLLGTPGGANAAVGYARIHERLVPAKVVDPSVPFAAGALRSSAADLVRWDRALTGGLVLSAESRRRMFTPVKEAKKEGYGYGIFVESVGGHEVHEHNGAIDGFSADLAGVADLRLTVVGLSNDDGFDPDILVDAALKMAVTGKQVDPPRERVVVPFDTATILRFVGEYTLDPASRKDAEGKLPPAFLDAIEKLSFVGKNGGLALTLGAQPPAQMFLGEDGRLFSKHDGVTIEGEPAEGGKGATKGVILRQGTFTLRWARAGVKGGK